MLVELVSKHIYLFVPTGKVDELSVIKAKSIDEAGRNMSKQVNNLPWNAEVIKKIDFTISQFNSPKDHDNKAILTTSRPARRLQQTDRLKVCLLG